MIVPMLVAIAGVVTVYATEDTGASLYGRAVAFWLIDPYAVTVSVIITPGFGR